MPASRRPPRAPRSPSRTPRAASPRRTRTRSGTAIPSGILSGRYLNNPWYWPKIWSYNPDIENPHWIYPGNLLKFFPSADEAPTRVEPIAEAEPEELAPVRELEDLSRANLTAPESIEEQDAVAVAGPYKIGYVAPRALLARHDTFVTPRELAESGAISAAFEEKLMLATLDKAYARFERRAGVKPGETYVVYKTERPIRHPRTNELFGWQSTVLGAAKVVAVDSKAATLVITHAFEPIERGAMLGPWTERFLRRVDRRANRRALEGMNRRRPGPGRHAARGAPRRLHRPRRRRRRRGGQRLHRGPRGGSRWPRPGRAGVGFQPAEGGRR